MIKEHLVTLEEKIAELLIDLKSKIYDAEEFVKFLKAKEAMSDYDRWYLGLREGQLATFQFIVCKIESTDVIDKYPTV